MLICFIFTKTKDFLHFEVKPKRFSFVIGPLKALQYSEARAKNLSIGSLTYKLQEKCLHSARRLIWWGGVICCGQERSDK